MIRHEYKNKEDFGAYFMINDGSAMGRVYGFYDDDKFMVLDTLLVNEGSRKKGIGTSLQEIRENYAKDRGCKYTLLWVEKDSWIMKWYERRGYVYSCDCDTKTNSALKENSVWMKKELNGE